MRVKSKKTAVIISYFTTIINYCALFFVTPITIKMLGQQEFGLYSLVNSVIGYLALLSLGLGSAYVRFYFRIKSEKYNLKVENLNGMYFFCYLIIAFAVIIMGTIFIVFSKQIFGSKLTEQEHLLAKILLGILTSNLAIRFIMSIFLSYLRAQEHFVAIEIANLIKVLLSPLIIIPLLLFGYGSIGLVLATTAISTIIEIGIMIYAIKICHIRFNFKIFDKKLLKEILAYSIFIAGFQILDQFNNGVDNMILGRHWGTSTISIYAVGAAVSTVIISLPGGINNVIVPEINKIVVSEEQKEKKTLDMQIKYGRIIFILIAFVLLGFVILGFPFLEMWAGEGFGESYLIVVILVTPKLFGYSLSVSSEYIKAKNMHKERLISYAIAVGLNIILTIPLSMKYGPLGAAIGTGFTYSLYIIFMNFYYIRVSKINLITFWKQIIKIVFIYSLITIPFIILGQYINLYNKLLFALVGVSFVCIFALVSYLFVFNFDEKNIIKNLFKLNKKNYETK